MAGPYPREEFYEASEEHIEEVNATGSGVAYDKQYYHADGSRWWGLFESQKLDDSAYVEFVVDITDRKQATERLHESEQRLRKAISIDTVGVLFFDLSGNISDANAAFERMSGYSREELLEIDWEALTPPEFMNATERKAAELATRGEAAPYEKQLIHKVGSRWWGLFAPERLSGTGETAKCVEFIFDITERKEVEEQLRESEERQRFLVELNDAIRPLTDPVEIQREAARVLGEWIDVSRAHYTEVAEDGETFWIHSDHYHSHVESVAGEHRLSDFGEYTAARLRAGERLVLRDNQSTEKLSDEEKATHAAVDSHANVAVPLVKDDRLVAFFAIDNSEPREWTETEVEMVEETAERTWAAVERARAEQARRESEERLRETTERLAVALDAAEMGTWEWDLDSGAVRADDRTLALFDMPQIDEPVPIERLVEKQSAAGVEQIKNVMDTSFEPGEEIQDEFYLEGVESPGWITWRGRASEDDPSVLRGVSFDVTERKEAEHELERQAEFDAFRVDLLDAFQPLTDPVEIQEAASRLLGTFLDATMAYYYEYDPETGVGTINTDYRRDDGPRIVGQYTFDDFPQFHELLLEGLPVVLTDTHTDPRLLPAERDQYDAMEFRSGVAFPFRKDGVLAAAMGVAQSSPREWTESEISLVRETAERTWLTVEWSQAEQALKASNEGLERLNAATREFLATGSETITDRVAGLVREVLNVEYAALWQYDDQRGDLEEHAVDTTSDVGLGSINVSTEISELVWQTFVGNDIDVATDLDDQDDTWGSLESRVLVPLGRHGVVCLGSTRAGAFDQGTVDLVEMVAATVETAWDRAVGEAELADRNEELARLNRLNTLIREIDKALVAADTREEIDEAVCERLADSDLYEFDWIGEHDPGTDLIEPRAWAGVDSGYLEDLEITVEDTPTNRDPIARAVRTGDLQVVADIATDSAFAPWREPTLERGARSVVCIPLVYEDTVYGVLTVYADHPQSDEDERNQEVLSELGHTIAHTINARETRATLQTDSVVELTLRFDDGDTPLCRLARETDCTVEYQGFVPRSNGHADVFLVAREVDSGELQATAEGLLAFEGVHCLTEREDGSLFRIRVSDPTLAARFTDAGAVVRSITIDAGVATAVVDIPHTAAVRTFLDQLRQWNRDFELLARQSRERPLKTRQSFVAVLDDRLTDRQREVLQPAYLSGFFEAPRVSNGKEVTELLGVSQPTFSEHLRTAQRRPCEVLFEERSTRWVN